VRCVVEKYRNQDRGLVECDGAGYIIKNVPKFWRKLLPPSSG